MVERVLISFEMDKEDILKMFVDIKQPFISKAFDDLLKTSFSSYIGIHIKNIRNIMNLNGYSTKEEQIEKIAIKCLKESIKEDMEKLQIEVVKAFFKESFTSKAIPEVAIYNACKTAEVMAIAENIQKKLIHEYLLAAV